MPRPPDMNAYLRIHVAPFRSVARIRSDDGRRSNAAGQSPRKAIGSYIRDAVRPLMGRIIGVVNSGMESREVRAARQVRRERHQIDRGLGHLIGKFGPRDNGHRARISEGTVQRLVLHAERCAAMTGSKLTARDVIGARLKASARTMSTAQRAELGRGLMAELAARPNPKPGNTASRSPIDMPKLWLEVLASYQLDALRPAIGSMAPIAKWEMLGLVAEWCKYLGEDWGSALADLAQRDRALPTLHSKDVPTQALADVSRAIKQVQMCFVRNDAGANLINHATEQLNALVGEARGEFTDLCNTFCDVLTSGREDTLVPQSIELIDRLGESARRYAALDGGNINTRLPKMGLSVSAETHALVKVMRTLYHDVENVQSALSIFDSVAEPCSVELPEPKTFIRGLASTVLYTMGEHWGGRPVASPGKALQLVPTRKVVTQARTEESKLADISQQVSEDSSRGHDSVTNALNPIFVRDALGPVTMRLDSERIIVTSHAASADRVDEIRLSKEGLNECNKNMLSLCDGDALWARRVSGFASQTGARIFGDWTTGGPPYREATITYEIWRASDQEVAVSIHDDRRNYDQILEQNANGIGREVSVVRGNSYQSMRCTYLVGRSSRVTLVEPTTMVSDIERSPDALCNAIESARKPSRLQHALDAIEEASQYLSSSTLQALRTSWSNVMLDLERRATDLTESKELLGDLRRVGIGVWFSRAEKLANIIGANPGPVGMLRKRLEVDDAMYQFADDVARIVRHVAQNESGSPARRVLVLCAGLSDVAKRMRRMQLDPIQGDVLETLRNSIDAETAGEIRNIVEHDDGMPMLRALLAHGRKAAERSDALPSWALAIEQALSIWDQLAPTLTRPGGAGGENQDDHDHPRTLPDLNSVQKALQGDAHTALGLYFHICVRDETVEDIEKPMSADLRNALAMDMQKTSDNEWDEVVTGARSDARPVIPGVAVRDVHRRDIWIGNNTRCVSDGDELTQELISLTQGNRKQAWMVARCISQEFNGLVSLDHNTFREWPFRTGSGIPCVPFGGGGGAENLRIRVYVQREPDGNIRVEMKEEMQNTRILHVHAPGEDVTMPALKGQKSWSVMKAFVVIDSEGNVRIEDVLRSAQWEELSDGEDEASSPPKSPPLFSFRDAHVPTPPPSIQIGF